MSGKSSAIEWAKTAAKEHGVKFILIDQVGGPYSHVPSRPPQWDGIFIIDSLDSCLTPHLKSSTVKG